ncbi:MAG TPA: PHP domain-containing protein [Dehalococcoidia bacterium]|nr:PHP domain-containing protein [Dehalococcoidia bacterium]HIK88222.1 PHP domain-containing protein [Dehalococcoidia bacterium]
MSDSPDQKGEGSRYDHTSPAVSPDWPVEIDLHLHTTASDGTLTPRELIDQVAKTTLRVVAVTDHDSTNGLAEAIEASAAHPQLTVIPGIELGTADGESELHLLGYFIDPKNPVLQSKLEQFRVERVEAARAMVNRLAELKRPVSWERIVEMASGSFGRPHIARAMVEAGHVETVAEAFDRYIGEKGVARIPRPKLHPVAALEMIHAAGGIGAIAHPRTVSRLGNLVTQLVGAGLAGIEVYAEKYASDRRGKYLDIATRYDLVPCGGTDYHALGAQNETTPGANGPPPDTVSKLLAKARAKHGSNIGNVPAGLG